MEVMSFDDGTKTSIQFLKGQCGESRWTKLEGTESSSVHGGVTVSCYLLFISFEGLFGGYSS